MLNCRILSRDMHTLCAPSSESDNSLHIYNDDYHEAIVNNVVVATYDFTVAQQHKDTNSLQYGNYIAFVNGKGEHKLCTIISDDGDDFARTWHAEDIGLGLLNSNADKVTYNAAHTFAWYANELLADTGWTIGVNEISNLTRKLSFDGRDDSKLARLGDIANQFDGAEIKFETRLDGSAIAKQVVNVYKHVGSDLSQQRFIDSVNLVSLQRSGTIANLRTAMTGYGGTPDNGGEDAEPITFADIGYDDGQFFSPKGDKAVYDRESGKQWAQAGAFNQTNKKATTGYLMGNYDYDTKDPNELLKRTITELKKVNVLTEKFEANVIDIQADIGDYIQIAHNNYNPPIYLRARVLEVHTHFTEAGGDTAVFGNYEHLESQIDPRVQKRIDEATAKKSTYVWVRYADDDQGNGMSALPAGKAYVAFVTVQGEATPSDNPIDYAGHWLALAKDGVDGLPGAPGKDGKTTYNHNAWADDVNGKTGFSTSYADGKLYVGQYSDFVQADSTDPSKYTWARFRGEDGKGIASTMVNYQASTSGTNIPTGTWLENIPAVAANQYLWTRTTWTYTDNTSANGYSVGKMGANGDKGATGNGIKSVVASYQNSTSGTVIPTGSWATTPPDTPQGQYLWTRNLTTFTNGGTSVSYSVAYNAKDGAKGDKGDPGSDNVPYMYTQTTTPTEPNPKENDIWFVGTSWQDASAIKRYVGGTWVNDNISQNVLNIKQLNAVNINGSVINGSSFVNSFDYTDPIKNNYKGTTEIANGSYKTDFTRVDTNNSDGSYQDGSVYIMPDGFHTYLEGPNGDLSTTKSISLTADNIVLSRGEAYGGIENQAIYLTADSIEIADGKAYGILDFTTLHQINEIDLLLWQGTMVMSSTQTVTPSLPIDQCLHGWMLLWSESVNGTSMESRFIYQPILKSFVDLHSGKGLTFPIAAPTSETPWANAAAKYLYVSNTTIKGYASNNQGVSNNYTLREVRAF